MSDVDALTCPKCEHAIEPTWDWCENCGYDPDGLKPPPGVDAPPPGQRLVAPEAPPPQKRGFVDENDPTDAGHNTKLLIGGVVLIVIIGIAGFVVLGRGETVDTSTGGTVPAVKAPFIGTPTSSQIATQKTENWWQVTPPDKSFTIEVPGVDAGAPKYKPERTNLGTRPTDAATYSGATAPTGSATTPTEYRLTVIDAPGDQAAALDQAITDLKAVNTGTTTADATPQDVDHQGHKAKQLTLSDKSGNVVTVRVVSGKGRIYTLTASGSQPPDPDQYTRFVESLKITGS